MIADLKVGAVYQVVTPYCVYSALALDDIAVDGSLGTVFEFTDINSDECDMITIPESDIESITKL